MATDLTIECKAGHAAEHGAKPPHIFSSACWLGFMAGQSILGMSGVKRATMGRGYKVNIETTGGNKVVVTFDKNTMAVSGIDRR